MSELTKNIISSFVDSRGKLDVLELTNVPFIPMRLFILRDVPPETIRGEHGHFSTDQYLITLKGEIELVMIDQNGEKDILTLAEGDGVFVPKKTWIRMKFAAETQVLVLASAPYNQEDYYYEPNEFLGRGRMN